jgi:hypothetical protein
MENSFQVPLTPEQLAAINAGGGYAQCAYPINHIHYQLIRFDPNAVDDDYIRAKIEEAYSDPTGPEPLDMGAVRAELQRRIRAKSDNGQ